MNIHFGTGFTLAVMVLARHPSEHPRKTFHPRTLYSPTGWGPDPAGEGNEKSLKCLSGNTAKLPDDAPVVAAGRVLLAAAAGSGAGRCGS